MTAESGAAFLLKIGDGAATPAFSTVAGMRATSVTVNQDVVDITNKESGGWRELLAGAGVRRVSVSGAGVFMNAQSETRLRGHAFAGTADDYQLTFENGDVIAGRFHLTALTYAGDYNGERSYTLSLESTGAVTAS